jgi:hypothetical protein
MDSPAKSVVEVKAEVVVGGGQRDVKATQLQAGVIAGDRDVTGGEDDELCLLFTE